MIKAFCEALRVHVVNSSCAVNSVALFETGFGDFGEDTPSIAQELLIWGVAQYKLAEQEGGNIALWPLGQ